MIDNFIFLILQKILKFSIVLFLIILFPLQINSSEILQIKGPDTIIVGDQNRNLLIKLFCVDVYESKESDAIDLLKKEFPRGSKVKIRPFGVKENQLIAKVFDKDGTKEMSELLISEDYTKGDCAS